MGKRLDLVGGSTRLKALENVNKFVSKLAQYLPFWP